MSSKETIVGFLLQKLLLQTRINMNHDSLVKFFPMKKRQNLNKIGKAYSLEYTKISEMNLMSHHGDDVRGTVKRTTNATVVTDIITTV